MARRLCSLSPRAGRGEGRVFICDCLAVVSEPYCAERVNL